MQQSASASEHNVVYAPSVDARLTRLYMIERLEIVLHVGSKAFTV